MPKELKFFNPNFDANNFTKKLFDDDFKYIDEEEIKGEELQKTKSGKAAVYSGKTTRLTYRDENFVNTIKSVVGPIDRLPIDNYEEKDDLDVERTVEFLKTKKWRLTEREIDEYQRDLFDF